MQCEVAIGAIVEYSDDTFGTREYVYGKVIAYMSADRKWACVETKYSTLPQWSIPGMPQTIRVNRLSVAHLWELPPEVQEQARGW